MTPEEARKASLAIPCPICGAKVGDPCRDGDRLRYRWAALVSHGERYAEARRRRAPG